MKKLIVLLLTIMLVAPASLMAATNAELEKMIQELQEEIEDLNDRTDKAEFHATTDRLQITGDFRNRMHSLHYQDATWNPAVNVDFQDFFEKLAPAAGDPTGPYGATSPFGSFAAFNPNAPGSIDPTTGLGIPAFIDGTTNHTALDNMFSGLFASNPGLYNQLFTNFATWAPLKVGGGVGPFPLINPAFIKKQDIDNDIAYNTRLRLNLMAKVASNVSFAGRLSMYKNWGDSTGTQVFDSWNAFTMDGTMGGNTTGNTLQVERAFFNWKNIGGSNFWFSVGRRPSTYGAPSNYRENEMRGGSPSGHLVHFNFDGMTLGYAPENGPEGMKIRFCYGQGFESQVGNGELFGEIATEDTQLGGFAIDAYDDGDTLVQVMAFGAFDVVDGFKGTFAFPTQLGSLFAPTLYHDMQKFPTFNFVTRYQPSTVIGDMYLGGLSVSREEENGLAYFASAGWTQLQSNGKAGMFGGMGNDAVFQANLNTFGDEIIMEAVRATDDDTNNGYGIYVGVQVPTSDNGKLGLEYNWGSEYWTPFTQGADDALGSKLAVRGSVYEGYYIHDINPNTFIKLAGLYYDYEYTNSGSPVGKPQKVDDVLNGTAYNMLPVVDTAWDANVTFNITF